MASRLSILLRVLFPVVILLGVDFWPASRWISASLSQAAVYERRGENLAAAGLLVGVQSAQPQRNYAERIAVNYARAGDAATAVEWFSRADETAGLSLDGLEAWADTYERAGNPQDALRIWRRLADERGDGFSARRAAELARQLEDWELAVAYAREWRGRSTQDAQAGVFLALLLASDDPVEALSLLEAAAKLDPSYGPAVLSLRQAAGLADLNPGEAYRYALMGRWLGGQGAWDLAEQAFTKSVKSAPDYAEALAFLGQAREQQGEDGRADLENALRLNPRSALVRALLAVFYASEGAYEAAQEQMRAASELEPEQLVWKIELANYTASAGDLISAGELFKAAQAFAPDDPRVWEAAARFSYAYSYEIRGMGLPAARRLIFLSPELPEGYTLAGVLSLALKDPLLAERFLQQALSVDPDHAPACLASGQVYLQLGDWGRADYYLRRAARLDPGGASGEAAQKLLDEFL